MAHSLLFIPDISGFTNFVQHTERQHSEHVIAELLEALISANTLSMELAEVEGDALFYYLEGRVPSAAELWRQIDEMFTVFYSHLKLFETHRICPCQACASAPELDLKIVVHSTDLQFISVQGRRKPFGQGVIQAHRLLKNSIDHDQYLLLSEDLISEVGGTNTISDAPYAFHKGHDSYDGRAVHYHYAIMDIDKLPIQQHHRPELYRPSKAADVVLERTIDLPAHVLYERISNFRYRHLWVKGVDELIYDEDEVNRNGTKHQCVIDRRVIDFVTISKEAPEGYLVYGEHTTSPPIVAELNQFFSIIPAGEASSRLVAELYWRTSNVFQRVIMALIGRRKLTQNLTKAVARLEKMVEDDATLVREV